jgi:hypothetical protein
VGERYDQMVAAVNAGLPTGVSGVVGDICGDYASQLANIATTILSLSTQFPLNRVPDPSTISVVVNGVTIPNSATNPAEDGGWTYNASSNSIVFVGSAYIPPAGATISVNYSPAAYGS